MIKMPILFKNIEYDLLMESVSLESDKDYVNKQIQSDDYINFLHQHPPNRTENVDYYILKKHNVPIGFITICYDLEGDIISAEPCILLSTKKSINTLKAFAILLEFLFFEKQIDRLEIKVYGNNKQMIHIMNKSDFCYEGKIDYVKMVNGEPVSILYYSLLKEEYYELLS